MANADVERRRRRPPTGSSGAARGGTGPWPDAAASALRGQHEVEHLQAQRLAVDHSGDLHPGGDADDQDQRQRAGPEHRHRRHDQEEGRRGHRVGQAHQEGVDPAAVEAGRGADQQSPAAIAVTIAAKPTSSVTCPPWSSRLNSSRPRSSVPSGWRGGRVATARGADRWLAARSSRRAARRRPCTCTTTSTVNDTMRTG